METGATVKSHTWLQSFGGLGSYTVCAIKDLWVLPTLCKLGIATVTLPFELSVLSNSFSLLSNSLTMVFHEK